MATLLLIVIFIAFIGLGIPDSLFGPAWPAIYKGFDIPISYASFVTMTVTAGTILSALFSARLIQKFGTRLIVVVSTFLTVIGLLGYRLSPSLVFMVISAIPLGLGAGCIDASLNNYVTLHYKNSVLNFLHCFYGVGVTLSPYIMSMALAENENWRRGYMIAFFIQLGIAIILLASWPLWNKVKAQKEEEVEMVVLPIHKVFTLPMAVFACLVFFTYCGVEVTSGVWSASFLVYAKGISVSLAAGICSLFYAGLATGRLVSGIVARWLGKRILVASGLSLMLVGIVLLLFSKGTVLPAISLFFLGFGCGPVFPNMMGLTPTYYGKEYSQSIIGVEMALSYAGTLSLSPLFGIIAERVGFEILPYYLLGIFTACAVFFIILMVLKCKNSQPALLTNKE